MKIQNIPLLCTSRQIITRLSHPHRRRRYTAAARGRLRPSVPLKMDHFARSLPRRTWSRQRELNCRIRS